MTTRAWLGTVVAALLLAGVLGYMLRGCAAQECDGCVAVTATPTPPPESPAPSSPSPSPTSASPSPAAPAPSPDPGGNNATGSGTGTGAGNGGGTIGGAGSFSISGNIATVLEPGATAPINLTVTNKHSRPLRIESLTVAIGTIRAPNATSTYPCTAADFSVDQPDGEANLVIPANSSRSLKQLGLTEPQWPSLSMLYTATNQNGCKGATVGLKYGGTAVWGDT